MTPEQIKFYFRSNKGLLQWILSQNKAQHIKMRYELEEEVKQGLRTRLIDKAELNLLTSLTSGDIARNLYITELKT